MKFKSFIAESEFPLLIKDIKGFYNKSMKVWVSQKSDTNELMVDIDTEGPIPFDKIDELIKTLKSIKKIKN